MNRGSTTVRQAVAGAGIGLLAICFAVLLFNSGSRFAIGLLLKPMADEFGSERTALAVAVTLFMTVTAILLPFVGRAVDSLGAPLVLKFGVGLSGVSLGLMVFVDSPLQVALVYGVLFAMGSAATSITPIGVLLTRRFPDRVGFANSIAISGMGVGQLLIVAGLASQLEWFGWRGAFLALALINLLLVLPLVVIVTREFGLAGDKLSQPPNNTQSAASVSVSSVWRSRYWWWLLGLYAICGFQDFFMATHVVAFASDHGVSAYMAGNLLALMGLFGLVGVLLTGWAADRVGPVVPVAICFTLRAVIFPWVLVSRDSLAINSFALAFGSTFWITAPLTVVFIRREFGMRSLGALSGLVTMVHHFSGGLGAFVGAAVFDRSGSYDGMLAGQIGLSVIALVICGRLALCRANSSTA